jgi:hypothetical protein
VPPAPPPPASSSSELSTKLEACGVDVGAASTVDAAPRRPRGAALARRTWAAPTQRTLNKLSPASCCRPLICLLQWHAHACYSACQLESNCDTIRNNWASSRAELNTQFNQHPT